MWFTINYTLTARNHKYGRQAYDDGDDDDDDSYSYGAGSSGANYGYTFDEGIYIRLIIIF